MIFVSPAVQSSRAQLCQNSLIDPYLTVRNQCLMGLTVLNRTAAITCQARPDIEIRRDPTTYILAIPLKERFV